MEQATDYKRYKGIFSVLALVVFIWGVIGTLDITHIPYAGYTLSPDNTVTVVRDGGPAAMAGLKVDDTITQIDGIAIDNYLAFASRERPAISSAGSFTITRAGTEQQLAYNYAPQPMTDILASFGALTLARLAFLILGLMVYLRKPTRMTSSFCALSLLFAFAFFNSPYFTSFTTRRLAGAIITFLVAILIAKILDYCLNYPTPKPLIAERVWLREAIYIIAIAYGAMQATIILTTPTITARRALLLTIAGALFFGGYLLLAIIAVMHSYIKADAEARAATGLNLMLLGLVIGFGPLVLSILLHTILPHMGELPGERFYTLALLALPIGMAMALMKLESIGVEAGDRAAASP